MIKQFNLKTIILIFIFFVVAIIQTKMSKSIRNNLQKEFILKLHMGHGYKYRHRHTLANPRYIYFDFSWQTILMRKSVHAFVLSNVFSSLFSSSPYPEYWKSNYSSVKNQHILYIEMSIIYNSCTVGQYLLTRFL